MDPVRNPFAPGAGTRPPELAGREDLIERADIVLARTLAQRPVKSLVLIGLRGVGKTVLLDLFRERAESLGLLTVRIEAPENRSLPGVLLPHLRVALLTLSRRARNRVRAERALRALSGMAKSLKFKYQDIEVGFDFEPEPGLADNGDLESDLQALLIESGQAAAEAETAIALFIDEMQYLPEDQLAALVTSLHRLSQLGLPVVLLAAGLPQLPGQLGKAKSYAERLFEFPVLEALQRDDAIQAIVEPLAQEEVTITPEAVDRILEVTEGYPYFIQEWGKQTWNVADDSPITAEHVEVANLQAVAELDASFFRVRFDRLTPAEKRYLRAMAELGPGPHRSGDIADLLGRNVTALAPTRSSLIVKGMIWSPGHGETAFTVPLFDQFLKRTMALEA